MGGEYKQSIFENEEYKKIIRECNEKILIKYGVNYDAANENNPLFFRRPSELAESILVCKEAGINYENGGAVLTRSSEDIKRIVSLCKKHEIAYQDNDYIFRSNADHFKAILDVCDKHNIKFNNSMIDTTSIRIELNATFIEENYGSMYLHPLALVQDCERVYTVFPYLKEKGYLACLGNNGGTMLTLTVGELKEREAVLGAIGEEAVVNGCANPIFGLSKEKYNEKYKNTISAIRDGQFTGGSKK